MDKIIYLQCDMRYNPYLLNKMDGKTVIEHTLDKICELSEKTIVSGGIYDCVENRKLVEVLLKRNVNVILSNEENVTKRMINTLRLVKTDYVIRVGGDMCLLDVKTTQFVTERTIEGNYDYYYYYGLSSCVPDIVKKEVLLEYENEVCKTTRYMNALENMRDIKRYIPELPMHSLCYPVRANSIGSIYWLEHIIRNNLNIYDLSNRIISGIMARDSELFKTGLLAEWGVPQDKKTFFVDDCGEVNPWLAMPVIELLKEKITIKHQVFEWGAGNSTVFFAKRTKRVVSVETDKEWCDKIQKIAGDNVVVKYVEYDSNLKNFSKAILEENELFDIILIDGRYERELCAEMAIQRIKEDGVIIVDNTDVEEYKESAYFLEKKGFCHLKLKGLMYGWIGHNCTTSMFYKKGNFMNL